MSFSLDRITTKDLRRIYVKPKGTFAQYEHPTTKERFTFLRLNPFLIPNASELDREVFGSIHFGELDYAKVMGEGRGQIIGLTKYMPEIDEDILIGVSSYITQPVAGLWEDLKPGETFSTGVALNKDYWGMGLGQKLREIQMQAQIDAGSKRLIGTVSPANVNMLYISMKLGYTVSDVLLDEYEDTALYGPHRFVISCNVPEGVTDIKELQSMVLTSKPDYHMYYPPYALYPNVTNPDSLEALQPWLKNSREPAKLYVPKKSHDGAPNYNGTYLLLPIIES